MTAQATAEVARAALAAAGRRGGEAWLVGGAVRDVLLGDTQPLDLDLAVAGDPSPVAAAVADALRAPRFALSDRFGGYRVTAAGGVQVDVMPLHADGLDADLRRRDLTINALALPLNATTSWPEFALDDLVDRTNGLPDLQSRVLRVCGPQSLSDDPLRILRIARAVATGQWIIDGDTVRLARAAAPALAGVAGERIGSEVRGVLAGTRPLEGLRVMSLLGATEHVLPELAALEGVTQSSYHHLDVAGHTREVLDYTIRLETELGAFVDDDSATFVADLLDDELGGGWTNREALRFAAILHDIAKPQTAVWSAERGGNGFPGHDKLGKIMAGEILERLRGPRRVVRAVQAMTLQHLRLGFLVHARPLGAEGTYDYLRLCDPVEVEVTVLALADRLATRGRRAERAIAAHAELTRELLPAAVAWRRTGGAPAPLLDGTALTAAASRPAGPWLAGALERQRRARYVDPALTEDQSLTAALESPDAQ